MAESNVKRDYERLKSLAAVASRQINLGVPQAEVMKSVEGFAHFPQLMDAKRTAYMKYEPEQATEQKQREQLLQKTRSEAAAVAKGEIEARRRERSAMLGR